MTAETPTTPLPVQSPMADGTQTQVDLVLVKMIATNARNGTLLNAVGMVVMAGVLWAQGAGQGVFWWLAAALGFIALQATVMQPRIDRALERGDVRQTAGLEVIGAVLLGAIWGLVSLLFFETDAVRMLILGLMVLCNVTAASTAIPDRTRLLSFCLPLALPLILRLALTIDPLALMLAAALALAMGAMLLHAVRKPVVRDRLVTAIADYDSAAELTPELRALARARGFCSAMMSPLIEDDEVIGVIAVSCREPHQFSTKEIDQVSSFANQAVIAIRNVRLFNDTRQALGRQTATAEVLQVIGQSMADARPVYDAILRSCERLFADAHMGNTLSGDDGMVHLAAHRGPVLDLAAFARMYPIPLAGSATSSSIAQRRVRQWPDVDNDPDVPTLARRGCLMAGSKALVFAPLVWGQRVIGALFVGRARVGPFSDKDIAMTVEANRPGTEGRYLGPHEMQAQMPACCVGPG